MDEEDPFSFSGEYGGRDGDGSLSSWWRRFLASTGEGPSRIDYSVLSVAVMTLGLIMVVEVVRHRLDQAAVKRPFFKAVLEGVYAELSTLGVVELFIWLLHSYYDDLDVAKEQVFAKVHFTLFYTAIFNAIQTVIVAFFSTRVSRHLWVKTETLELNHYVEIREEFQRVNDALEEIQGNSRHGKNNHESTSSSDDKAEIPTHSVRKRSPRGRRDSTQSDVSVFAFELSRQGLRRLWRSIVYQVRYPHLKRKYNQLVVQVRFHELRVHFLQAYKLPLKLKISDYLMRSELNVLIRLVHVSIIAWLLLTGATNLLYFVMGIIAYETENSEIVGTVLIAIFFACMGGFVLIAVALHIKMKAIFQSIMHQRQLWDIQEEDEEKDQLSEKQLKLFWFAEPKMVIAAIQFMQFGYAVALAVVLIFWDQIDDGTVGMHWYLIIIAIAYSVFVFVVAKVIPRYTLCTSMGQLVDERRLQDTVSAFQLQEAKREQSELQHHKVLVETAATTLPSESLDELSSASDHRARTPEPSLGLPSAFTVLSPSSPGTALSSNPSFSEGKDSAELMAELVKLDTVSLRTSLPPSEREALSRREERRKNRRKSVSDGVGAMARMSLGTLGGLGLERAKHSKDDSELDANAGRRMRDVAAATTVPEVDSPADPKLSEELKPEDTTPESLRARRRTRGRRRKSVSDGVALMSSLLGDGSSMTGIPESVPEDTVAEHDASAMTTIVSQGRPPRYLLSDESREETRVPSDASDHPNEDFVADSLKSFVEDVNQTLTEYQQSFLSDESEERRSKTSTSVEPAETSGTAKPDEGSSIPSTDSVGGLSDGDDIPEVDEMFLRYPLTKVERPTLRQRCRAYYLSKRFVLLSNVFGTMVAFFMIGQRVEGFLSSQGIIDGSVFVSFDFPNKITFWVLFTWFVLFLITSCMVFVTLGPVRRLRVNKERAVFLAAVFDGCLVTACLVLFCVAETQRCCYPGNQSSRPVAGELGPAPCSCPEFGSRLYGGLGMIEPFISLIALRVFRHWAARGIVNSFSESFSNEMRTEDHAEHEAMPTDPFAVFGDTSDPNETGMTDERGTISELWQAAVVKYPEITETYGQFSGELLQAMLGVPIAHRPPSPRNTDSTAPRANPLTLGREYTGLSPHAQEIIVAGKVGRAVKATQPSSAGDSRQNTTRTHSSSVQSSRRRRTMFFEVDEEANRPTVAVTTFISPNASLVRSMRRCDRKLLPILDKWTVVDVAITRFEMVYFDAAVVDDANTDPSYDDTRQALAATKGGKGLRLCDVAAGRRVVGQLQLTDIKSVHVEREMPHEYDDNIDGQPIYVRQTEYWKKLPERTAFCRDWHTTKQDTLQISSNGGTLCLRFYSDLEDSVAHRDRVCAENEEFGPLFKNSAFHWAQTIGRFCGPEQLKQPLLHFGDDSADELRDYLVVKREESKEGRHRRVGSGDHLPNFWNIPRAISTTNLARLNTPKPATVRRSNSVSDGDTASRRKFNHSASLDDSAIISERKTSLHRRSMTSLPVVGSPDVEPAAGPPNPTHGQENGEDYFFIDSPGDKPQPDDHP